MSKIIPLEDYKMSEKYKLEYGLEKLDEALTYFDDMNSFEGKNLSSITYIAIKYGEDKIKEMELIENEIKG